MRVAAAAGAVALLVLPTPAQVPPGGPNWQLNRSTIIMACNASGPMDPTLTQGWAVVDFDWSNWKGLGSADGWAKSQPMDCDEKLEEQVRITKAASPATQVWVYRNLARADPWFSAVRIKLEDPAYREWFMPFAEPFPANTTMSPKPPYINSPFPPTCCCSDQTCGHCAATNICKANRTCDSNFSPPKCSRGLYFDRLGSPGYPHGSGDCRAPGCDCGKLPCGQYIFNHMAVNKSVRGQTFGEWFLKDYLALDKSPHISGYYFDDEWTPDGVTESAATLITMGLTKEEGFAHYQAYWTHTNAVIQQLLRRGKFSWMLLYTGQAADCRVGPPGTTCAGSSIALNFAASVPPSLGLNQTNCAAKLRSFCSADSEVHSRTLMYQFAGTNTTVLPEFERDLAIFLLVRGPHAYIGHSWRGCAAGGGAGPFHYPDALNADLGEPVGLCRETANNVFERDWTKARVRMDCSDFEGTVTMKSAPPTADATVHLPAGAEPILHAVSDGFVSFAMDFDSIWGKKSRTSSDTVLYEGVKLDFNNTLFKKVVAMVSGGVLRVGGVYTDFVHPTFPGSNHTPPCPLPANAADCGSYPALLPTNDGVGGPCCITLSMERWREILDFASATGMKVGFNLNALTRGPGVHSRKDIAALCGINATPPFAPAPCPGGRCPCPAWDPTEAEALMRWTRDNVPEAKWPAFYGLGNELTFFIPPERYAADIATLTRTVRKVFGSSRPKVYAPCSCGAYVPEKPLAAVVDSNTTLDAWSYHFYPSPNLNATQEEQVLYGNSLAAINVTTSWTATFQKNVR